MEEVKESRLIKDLGNRKVVSYTGKEYVRHYGLYECCYCKKEFEHDMKNMRVNTKAKGCKECNKKIQAKVRVKHGLFGTRIYRIWGGMITRCENTNDKAYKDWGGRGISICKEWRNDPEQFKNWAIENGYSDELSIDRIDNDGNYEPSNCRWVTQKVQANNTRLLNSKNTTGYRGVRYRFGKYFGQFKVNGKHFQTENYDTAKAAALARDTYIIVYGLPHKRNFP